MSGAGGTTVGLFGGSFNPPHAAHQLVALYCLETQPIDQIWFMPVYDHVFGKDLAPFADRMRMCEQVAAALGPRARVTADEEDLAKTPGFVGSRTFDLLEMLARNHPTTRFRWIVGTDILSETDKWHRWDDVVAMAPLIVVGRTGHPVPAGSSVTGLAMPEVSSTAIRAALAGLTPEVREALRRGEQPAEVGSLRSLLPASVLRYIAERDLYS